MSNPIQKINVKGVSYDIEDSRISDELLQDITTVIQNSENPPEPTSEIDDSQTAQNKTWSSSKINQTISNALGNISTGLTKRVVNSLPQIGEDNVLYLIPKSSYEGDNIKDEYLYINHQWEKIGDTSTSVDLSDYYNKQQTYSKQQVDEMLAALPDNDTQYQGDGNTIEIINNTIKVKQGVFDYTSGSNNVNIDPVNRTISVTESGTTTPVEYRAAANSPITVNNSTHEIGFDESQLDIPQQVEYSAVSGSPITVDNTTHKIGFDSSQLDIPEQIEYEAEANSPITVNNTTRKIGIDTSQLPQSIEYEGEGGVVVNNTTHKISLEDGIITQPADPNHDNNYYIYNGVKVTVPQGRGYILLRNNYNLPEGADPSFYEAGLYIEDENIDAPTGCESITVARFQSSDFPYIIDEPEYLPHDGSNDIDSNGGKIYNFSFLSSRHDYSSPTYGLMSYYMNVIINKFGSRDNTAANPTESLFKIGDFCFDNFGNLYKILSVTKTSNTYLGNNILRIKFKLHRAALQSRSNYYNSYSSYPSTKRWSAQAFDEITWEENRDNGDWYDWNNHWDPNTGTSVSEEQFYSDATDDETYPKPDDESWSKDRCNGAYSLNTFGMTYSFRGAYKNPQTNKVFYLYGTPNDVVAICCYLREMDNGNIRPAFAGFITFGTPFSLEQPLDRHDEDTEVQAYNWTEPRPQIKFVDATSISGALANIDTTTYQADDIVVIKNPGATLTFPKGNSTVTLHDIPFEPQFRWNGTEFKPMFYFIN